MTSIPQSKVNQMREWVASGDLLQALEAIQSYGNDFLNLLAWYKRSEKEKNQGIMSNETYRGEVNRIQISFLNTLDEFCEIEGTENPISQSIHLSIKQTNDNYKQQNQNSKWLLKIF